jgi:hypothetical protein
MSPLELHNLIQLPQATTPLVTSSSTTTVSPNIGSKGIQTKFACAIYSEYGHYNHHCLTLPHFWKMLMAVRQSFQQEPLPSTSSQPHVTDIHYVTTSINECMRCHFSLCESIDHFTYQCPMIIEYTSPNGSYSKSYTPPLPSESVITPTPSPNVVHIFSLEPEALLTPPWFLDSLYEDFPPNPPNSLVHFPMKMLRPTPIFNPQYLDIWFMSRKPSQPLGVTPPTSSPPEDNHMMKITNVTPPNPLYS